MSRSVLLHGSRQTGSWLTLNVDHIKTISTKILQAVATRGELTSAELPDCPYAFPKSSLDRIKEIESHTQTKLGIPANIQGPYTSETLDWISKYGRKRIDEGGSKAENGQIVCRSDYLDKEHAEVLKAQLASGYGVYFYEWYDVRKSGKCVGSETGFIVVDRDRIVAVIGSFVV